MDAEWKPLRSKHRRAFPRVSILQLACRLVSNDEECFCTETPSDVETDRNRMKHSSRETRSPTFLDQKFSVRSSYKEDDYAENLSVNPQNLHLNLQKPELNCSDGSTVKCRKGENEMGGEVKEPAQKLRHEVQDLNLDSDNIEVTNVQRQNLDVKPSEGDKYLELSLSRLKAKQEMIFLLDMLSLPIQSLWEVMKRMLVSPAVVKLGFKFKQDLFNLAKSFPGPDAHCCFDKVYPYVDIGKVFLELFEWNSLHVEGVSLAALCEQVVGYSLCKDLQCSNWEQRPLTAEQHVYAAADAHCLLVLYDVLEKEASKGQESFHDSTCTAKEGIAELLLSGPMNPLDINANNRVLHAHHGVASLMVRAAVSMGFLSTAGLHAVGASSNAATHMQVAKKFGERLLLNGEIRRTVVKKKKKTGQKNRDARLESQGWFGLPPWDPSCGGDGTPKFVCDNMVEGLAKQLRNVGFDTVFLHTGKSDPRKMVELAEEEGRVLLTQDTKLLQTRLIPPNLAYHVKSNGKQKQLAEVVKRFNLVILEDNLLSRCNKCNGDFFPNPLTPEEALASVPKGQILPDYAIRERVLFWQCSKCSHMYWQGKQFHRALETFQAFAREVRAAQ